MRVEKSFTKSMRIRLIREARRLIEEHIAIDWSQYSEPEINHDTTGILCDITWKRLSNGSEIGIGKIYYAENGSILQAGTNYGRLSI